MTAKRTSIALGAAVLVAALLALWLIPFVLLNAKYERARINLEQDLGPPFSVRPFDGDMQKTLGVIESTWECTSEEVSGPYSDAMRLAGIVPSAEGLIQLYNYRMPQFSWLDLSQNRKSLEIGAVQAVVVTISIDNTIHFSAEQRLALVRVSKRTVLMFRETESGLSETVWVGPKENFEQDAPADADKPRR